MSRGPGQLQQTIMSLIGQHTGPAIDTKHIAAAIFGTPSASEASRVRRALGGLARRGQVVRLPRILPHGGRQWGRPERIGRVQSDVAGLYGPEAARSLRAMSQAAPRPGAQNEVTE